MSWISDTELTWYEKLCVNVLKCGPIPRHIAFIMDGNRRFARQKDLQTINGHVKGFEKLSETLRWCLEMGITEVTVYAFSIENFKRSKEEVDNLLQLAREKYQKLLEEKDKLMSIGVCIRVIGNLDYVPADIRKMIAEATLLTKDNNNVFLNVAFSYTSRDEITSTVVTLVNGVKSGSLKVDDIDRQLFSDCLYTSKCSPPDILIRTSGELRLSDFLLWQIENTNIYFTDVLWPDFCFWHLCGMVFKYQVHLKRVQPSSVTLRVCRTEEQSVRANDFVKDLDCKRLESLQQMQNSSLGL